MARSGQTGLDGLGSCPAAGGTYLKVMDFAPSNTAAAPDGQRPQSVQLTAIGGAAYARVTGLHGAAERGTYLPDGVPIPLSCGSGIVAVEVVRATGSSAEVAFSVTDAR